MFYSIIFRVFFFFYSCGEVHHTKKITEHPIEIARGAPSTAVKLVLTTRGKASPVITKQCWLLLLLVVGYCWLLLAVAGNYLLTSNYCWLLLLVAVASYAWSWFSSSKFTAHDPTARGVGRWQPGNGAQSAHDALHHLRRRRSGRGAGLGDWRGPGCHWRHDERGLDQGLLSRIVVTG